MNYRYWFLCTLFCCVLGAFAQKTYYKKIEGLKREHLKTALHELIKPDSVLNYGGKGEGYTWAGFAVADAMEGGYVRDRYSNTLRKQNGLMSVTGMNIEHVFANSWWGHTVNDAYCDLYNLYPSDGTANGRKSNNPVGVVTGDVSYDNGVIKVGRSSSYRADSLITVWEPADEWKGDFARTYFYVATCYEDYQDLWQTAEGLLMVSKNRYPTLRPWVSKLLLKWNKEDPVDDIERARNQVVQTIQGNRNPFVDYPQLSTYIWGDSTDYAFYTNPSYSEPELFVPSTSEVLDFGLQPLSQPLNCEFVLRGRNMSEDVVLQLDNKNFTLSKDCLSPEQVRQGVSLSLLSQVKTAGVLQTMLSIKSGNFEQTNTIKVEFVDGIPAYPASDVVCSVNAKKFTASWMPMQGVTTYSLDVYTKSATGTATTLSGYPVSTTASSFVVSNLKASTTYYYQVTGYDASGRPIMYSNEVQVNMPTVKPVFTTNVSEIHFTSSTQVPSKEQVVAITALEVPQYVTTIYTSAPFEVSADGVQWGEQTTVSGSKQTLYVRMGSVSEEGFYEAEMIMSTSKVEDIVVSLTGEVNNEKSFFENFESGSKGAYAEAEVECSACRWRMAQSLLGSGNDRYNDSKSVRMQSKSGVITELEMLEDKTDGCDSLSFYAGMYNTDTGVKLTVSYSLDAGKTWTDVVKEMSFKKGEWKRYAYYLHVKGAIRLKFKCTGTSGKRLNIDDIQMNDYQDLSSVQDASRNNDSEVDVYTLNGIKVKTSKRADALNGLKPAYYIVKDK